MAETNNPKESTQLRQSGACGVRPPDLREQLAAYAHEAWSGWMKYMFDKCENYVAPEEKVIIEMPYSLFERWHYQMNTPYENLPEEMKPSDRDEADKILEIVFNFHKDAELISLKQEVSILRDLLKQTLGEEFLEKTMKDALERKAV